MKAMTWLCLIFLVTPLFAHFDKQDARAVMAVIVAEQPADREVMFVNLLFAHLKAEIAFDADNLKTFYNTVEQMSARRFEKIYGGDPGVRTWLMDNLQDLRRFNEAKWNDLNRLAKLMSFKQGSLELQEALTNLSRRKLLFLIQFASKQKPLEVLAQGDADINTLQLLTVMRAELNARSGR